MIVPRATTAVTPDEMLSRIVELYQGTYGRLPSASTAAWLLTLLWHENRGGRAINNYNWGNVTAGSNWAGDTWETATHKFRVYPDHGSGSRGWWDLLHQSDGTHLRIVRAAESGSARAFFEAVSTPHPVTHKMYCYGCDEAVAKEYQRIFDNILRLGLVAWLPVGRRHSASGDGAIIPLLITVGVVFVAWRWMR